MKTETFGALSDPRVMNDRPEVKDSPKPPQPEKGKTPDSTAPEEEPKNNVDEAGEESFPASDPPSSNP